MFTIRRFAQLSIFNARKQNKYFSTVLNGDANDKTYPLDGIRILDLTRIGKFIILNVGKNYNQSSH